MTKADDRFQEQTRRAVALVLDALEEDAAAARARVQAAFDEGAEDVVGLVFALARVAVSLAEELERRCDLPSAELLRAVLMIDDMVQARRREGTDL